MNIRLVAFIRKARTGYGRDFRVHLVSSNMTVGPDPMKDDMSIQSDTFGRRKSRWNMKDPGKA